MFARIRPAWRAWRERRRQYAIDRALYKMGGGTKRTMPAEEGADIAPKSVADGGGGGGDGGG